MRLPPVPLRHLGPVKLAQLRQCRGQRIRKPHRTALVPGLLGVVTPILVFGQDCFHDPRLQVPVARHGIAKPAGQDFSAELAQPGGEQQRFDLVAVHAKVPAAELQQRLTAIILRDGQARHQRDEALRH